MENEGLIIKTICDCTSKRKRFRLYLRHKTRSKYYKNEQISVEAAKNWSIDMDFDKFVCVDDSFTLET